MLILKHLNTHVELILEINKTVIFASRCFLQSAAEITPTF